MSSSSSKKKRSSSSSPGSLRNTRDLLLVGPGTPSPLSSVSGSIGSFGLLGSDSSVESNSPGLQNTAALLRVPLSPRSSSDSISAATYKGLSSSSSSRSRSRGRGRGRDRAGPASRRIMFRINPRAGPTVYGVPRIAPPPGTRRVRMVAPKRNSSLERRRRAEWREFGGNLRDKFGITVPSSSSSLSSSSSSVSRRRSPSRSRTPSPK